MTNPAPWYPNWSIPQTPAVGGIKLKSLVDVDNDLAPATGDVLTYNAGEWTAATNPSFAAEYATIYHDAQSTNQITDSTPGTYNTINFTNGSNDISLTLVPEVADHRIVLPVGSRGIYNIAWSASFLGSPNAVYTIAPFLDNTRIPSGTTRTRLPGADLDGTGSATANVLFISGISPGVVELRVACNQASKSFVPSHLSLTVTRIASA